MGRKVLVLSRSLPPAPTGSATVVGNLARQFSCDEMVLAGEKPASPLPLEWDPRWPTVHYLAQSWEGRRRGARWWRRLMLPLTLARLVRLARHEDCRALVAVFPKEEQLLLGYLAARLLRADFYPYFHNTYAHQRRGTALRFAQWLEPRVFKLARHVLVMSEGMADLYLRSYPEIRGKCSPLVHSFEGSIPPFEPPPPPGEVLECAFCGSVAETCRDALARCARVILSIPRTRLRLYTGTPREAFSGLGLTPGTVEVSTPPREDLAKRLQQADVLILPHGLNGGLSEAEFMTIFPTKTVDYLVSGRPILAHATAGSFLARFLRERDCALVVEQPDEEQIRQALLRLRADGDLRNRLVAGALKAAEQFRPESVARTFRALTAQ